MMYRYREYLERDEGEFPKFDVDREAAKRILARAKAKGWSRLPELEAMDLLRAYGLQIATTKFCRDAQEAEAAAGEIGYPVALKAIGAKLVHKTEYGDVALDIRGSEELRDACGAMEKRL